MTYVSKLTILDKDYMVRLLNIKDEALIQELSEKSIDYFQIVEGKAPEKNAGKGILTDLPPNKSIEDKHVLGCFNEEGSLIAVIDIVSNYPENGDWIIGLLLIDPKYRGKGLGKGLHQFIREYVHQKNATNLRIGVVEDNKNACQFWSSLGYREVKRVNMIQGMKENMVIVMNLLLDIHL